MFWEWDLADMEEFARHGLYAVINDGRLMDLVPEMENSASDDQSQCAVVSNC